MTAASGLPADGTATSRSSKTKLQVVALGSGAIILGFVAQWQLVRDGHFDSGLVAWGLALALFLLALLRARLLPASGGEADGRAAEERPMSSGGGIALLIVVLGVGAFFRLYKIGSLPPGLNHDAAWEAIYAVKITHGIPYAAYVAEANGRETLFHYVVALAMLFMGRSQFALQFASISIGVATIVATYLLVRRLFDTRTALVAALLLAVSGWHITLSRVGWREILVPLFIPLIFFFLVKAVEERRRRDFLIAGVLLGLSLDTYDAARVLPFTAMAFLVYETIQRPSLLTKNYMCLVAFGACAAIAFSPLGWYATHHWQEFTYRGRSLWVGSQVENEGSLKPLVINLKDALLLFNFRGNGDDFFIRQPVLDLPVSVVFPLGVVIAATRCRQRSYFLLLLMLTLDLVVGIASKPNGNRDFGAVIPVTALAAVFLVQAWRWMRGAFPQYHQVFGVGLVGVLAFAGWVTFDGYLGPHHRDQWGYYPEATRVGRYIHKVPPDYNVYVGAQNWPRYTLTFLSYAGQDDPFLPRYWYTSNPDELLTVTPPKDHGAVFIVEDSSGRSAVVNALQRRYPSATTEDIYYPAGERVVARAVAVPAYAGDLVDSGTSGKQVRPAASMPATHFSALNLDIWPEFDKPSALFMLEGTLAQDVPLPTTITFTVPSDAGDKIAVVRGDRSLVRGTGSDPVWEWTEARASSGTTVTFQTFERFVGVSFYLPMDLSVNRRNVNYVGLGEFSVDSLNVYVQRPVGASDLTVDPQLPSVKNGLFGIRYYSLNLKDVSPGSPLKFTVNYTKADSRTSIDALEHQYPTARTAILRSPGGGAAP